MPVPAMPTLTLLPEEATAAASLSFGIANPLPSQPLAPAVTPVAFYDLLPAEDTPPLELASTEAAWAPTERLGL